MSSAVFSSQPAPRVKVPAGTSAQTVVNEAGFDQKGAKAAIVVRDGAVLRDLAWVPEADADVEVVLADTPDGRNVIRHSTAHILAQAVQAINPDAKLGIGPPITDGFYYDFSVAEPITPEDLQAIEKQMKKIIKSGQRFSRRKFASLAEAQAELAGEPFKIELITDKGTGTDADDEVMEVDASGELTIYDNIAMRGGECVWGDLCRGPHVPSTRYLGSFKITRSSAAYWRGQEGNAQLQRIYGTAWESAEALADYLHRLEEAEKRDHRRVGAELDLFSFPDELGSGLPVFHPKGGVIKREMEDYVRARHIEEGFQYVGTPHISKDGLFHTSGHLPYYADTMFPPLIVDEEIDDEGNVTKAGHEYRLKAMNCPMHNLIYRSRGRSYRELPLRLFEFGHVYRYEKSGVVHGLTRVRGFAQDDSHSYVMPEQAADEVRHLLDFILGLLRDFGLDDFYLELSTRDDSDKFIGSQEQWSVATTVLEDVAGETGLELVPDPGGAAYYGPKISVQARDAIGRSWQMSTIQYDFNQPARFELEYQAPDGTRQQPVMIHAAKFGSIERFMGVLVEHYAGAFPAWLAPVQVVGIPISGEQGDYIQDIVNRLAREGIRAEADHSDDRMQKKVRNHTLQKIPFMLLAGAKDVDANAVSFRFRDGTQRNGVPVDEAIADIVEWVRSRRNAAPTADTRRDRSADAGAGG
ncbi:threonine--tRNA ligase [Cumulibacter soli]|uniref:threonine--tRNA ligase n=1 Tax=Cumulibacter soli TaxID=2546344 RepID=UPI0010682C08|nr:threonine--tRNA ligase [Cumulibacter soli]